MTQSRNARIGEQMQRELAELLRLEVKDPRVGMVTLTGVEVTRDLAHAKVFFTTLLEGADRADTLTGLHRSAGYLRTMLGKRMRIRTIPELHFLFDASIERGAQLSKLIDDAIANTSPNPAKT